MIFSWFSCFLWSPDTTVSCDLLLVLRFSMMFVYYSFMWLSPSSVFYYLQVLQFPVIFTWFSCYLYDLRVLLFSMISGYYSFKWSSLVLLFSMIYGYYSFLRSSPSSPVFYDLVLQFPVIFSGFSCFLWSRGTTLSYDILLVLLFSMIFGYYSIMWSSPGSTGITVYYGL